MKHPPRRPFPGRLALAAPLFFLSGAFALVYQLAWVRRLGLELGSTHPAEAAVVSMFVGGLGLGAWLIGRRVDRWRSPLATYGWLEIGVSLYSLVSLRLFDTVLAFCLPLVTRLQAEPAALAVLRLGAAAVLLLPPAALMGATLPPLSRFAGLELRQGRGGRGAAALYAVNTLGASGGALAAGLVLLPRWGLARSLLVTATANLALGALVLLFAYRSRATAPSRPTSPGPRASEERSIDYPTLCGVVAATGFAALACEVLWTRAMALVLGTSAFAFTFILAIFLLGLGAGALAVNTTIDRLRVPAASWLFWSCLGAGLAISLSTRSFDRLPGIFHRTFWAWEVAAHPQRLHLLEAGVVAAVVLVPTLLMGGILPAAFRVALDRRRDLARRVGGLYAASTFGSLLGSLLAGFVLIPRLGLATSLSAMAALYPLAALVVAQAGAGEKRRRRVRVVLALSTVGTLGWLAASRDEPLMASGIYAYAEDHAPETSADLPRGLRETEDLLYHRDGLDATVTVTRGRNEPQRDLLLRINGKIDGSSHSDMANQRLLAHVPLLLHPAPRTAAVVGLGTGATAGSATLHGLQHLIVIEIEAAVVEASMLFRHHNHAVGERDEVDIRVGDGNLFLRTNPNAFDVVISQPSNPWQSGNSDLFTREYFAAGALALRQDGLFAAWIPLYRLSPENLRTLLRTFLDIFPHAHAWMSFPNTDLIVVGSRDRLVIDPQRMEAVMADSAIREDLADPRVQVLNVHDLLSHLLMGPGELREFVGNGPLQTFDLPVVLYRAALDVHQPDLSRKNFDLLRRLAPGACGILRRESAGSDGQWLATLSGVGRAYRRWRISTATGVYEPWAAQADVCSRRKSRFAVQGF